MCQSGPSQDSSARLSRVGTSCPIVPSVTASATAAAGPEAAEVGRAPGTALWLQGPWLTPQGDSECSLLCGASFPPMGTRSSSAGVLVDSGGLSTS